MSHNRNRVILESPYATDETRGLVRARNLLYLRACIRDSAMNHDEAPFASHRMYTDALDDSVPEEREVGIECGYVWWLHGVKHVVFYIDLGYSAGMLRALSRCVELKQPYIERTIGFRWENAEAAE